MTLKMGMEALWCSADQHLVASEGVCGMGGRRALGVGFAAQLWVLIGCGAYLGSHDDTEVWLGGALVQRSLASGDTQNLSLDRSSMRY